MIAETTENAAFLAASGVLRPELAAPVVMAILNVTPDSFFDGGRFQTEREALDEAGRLLERGADLIDVGAESTRPGAASIAPDEQMRRIGSVIEAIVARGGRVSIDTTSSEVATFALERGASMVNSVSLAAASRLAEVAALHGASLVLMHSRGPMEAMAGFSTYPEGGYADVVADVRNEWLVAAERALAAGLPRERLFFDPGLGFQKSARQSIEHLGELSSFLDMGFPIAIGPSRKSFIAKTAALLSDSRGKPSALSSDSDGKPSVEAAPAERLGGTIAATLAAVERGASLVRVHDPFEVRQALAIRAAIGRSCVSRKARSQDRTSRGAP